MTPTSGRRGARRRTFRTFRWRFSWAAAYFVVLFAAGTAGYVAVEGWDWPDALYQTVTTVTSVGFMEVRPLSEVGRDFTMVLIALGVTGLGIWWGLITALIVEFDLREIFREKRMAKEIARLQDHFILCGMGRMGRVVAEEMARSGVPFVAVERDPARIRLVEEEIPDLLHVDGDATREHTLTAARIEAARGLAACLTDDGDNLLLAITARGMNAKLTIVARAHDEEVLEKLRRAGANHAISPNVTGGVRMASTLLRPSVVSFLDVTTGAAGIDLRLEEVEISAGSGLGGRTLAEARIPQRTGLVVIALRRLGQKAFVYNPGPETRLQEGDLVVVLGRPEQVAGLREYLSTPAGGGPPPSPR